MNADPVQLLIDAGAIPSSPFGDNSRYHGIAVARHAQGEKMGAALLQDAVNRTLVVAQNTGVRALLVHALHERAKQFYEHYGFQASPVDAMVLMLRVRV